MTDPLLKIRGLKTWLGEGEQAVRAVDGVDFSLRRGETFALLGESGCGKSMTALSVMRLLPTAARVMAGSVSLSGQELLALPETEMRRVRGGKVGMIFQEPQSSLNPVLTVGDQIGESLTSHHGLRGTARQARVLELLDAVGIPDPARRSGEYPHQMSGGMKQRVMIAMALAGEPELLIADEPTTALDVTIQAQVLDLLRKLQQDTGMAILLITHDLGVVAEMADYVSVMYAGQIVESAPCDEFFRAPRHPYSRKLFASLPDAEKRSTSLAVIPGSVPSLAQAFSACRFENRCDRAWEPCRERLPRWLDLDETQGVRCHLYDGEVPGQGPEGLEPDGALEEGGAPASQSPSELLQVDDLAIHFPIHKGLFKRVVGHVKAVDGVSIRIREGRTVALVGESGCGKTTVGKGILQLLRPTRGSVRLRGDELTDMSQAELRPRRSDMQIVFQDPYSSMNPRMLTADIVAEGMQAQGIGGGRRDREARVERLLEQVGLNADASGRYPHEFSGGQRQRICIARALAVEPRLIICDEPTSALDVSVQAQILNLLKKLQNDLGLAYLFITHNISVVEYLAHEVAVMYLGRIVEYGPVAEVLENPRHPYTQALLSAVPVADPERRREIIRLEGDLPSPADPPPGCHFHPRCSHARPQCSEQYPGRSAISATHHVHCHLLNGEPS